jgi:hypothetical protein
VSGLASVYTNRPKNAKTIGGQEMEKRPPIVDLPTCTCSSIIEKALSFKEMSLKESATDYALFDDEWEGDDWPDVYPIRTFRQGEQDVS